MFCLKICWPTTKRLGWFISRRWMLALGTNSWIRMCITTTKTIWISKITQWDSIKEKSSSLMKLRCWRLPIWYWSRYSRRSLICSWRRMVRELVLRHSRILWILSCMCSPTFYRCQLYRMRWFGSNCKVSKFLAGTSRAIHVCLNIKS